MIKYDLPDCFLILNNPPTKVVWKRTVRMAVNNYWVATIKAQADLYSSLQWLNINAYKPGVCHPLVTSTGDLREVPRIAVKLKIVTGTYILETTRAAFNQNAVNPICLVCNGDDETLRHFLLDCPALQSCREPVMHRIIRLCEDSGIDLDSIDILQLLIDSSKCCDIPDQLSADIEKLTRLLCYKLHSERYKKLELVPKRRRKK